MDAILSNIVPISYEMKVWEYFFLSLVQSPASRIVAGIFLELAFSAEIRVMMSSQNLPGILIVYYILLPYSILFVNACLFLSLVFCLFWLIGWLVGEIWSVCLLLVSRSAAGLGGLFYMNRKWLNTYFVSISFSLYSLSFQPLLLSTYVNRETQKLGDLPYRHWNCWLLRTLISLWHM